MPFETVFIRPFEKRSYHVIPLGFRPSVRANKLVPRSLMYFKWGLFRKHIKKWIYVAKNGFKWLYFLYGKDT